MFVIQQIAAYNTAISQNRPQIYKKLSDCQSISETFLSQKIGNKRFLRLRNLIYDGSLKSYCETVCEKIRKSS